MSKFKIELRVLVAAIVAFVAAYSINSFFEAMLKDCAGRNIIKVRFWYMVTVVGVAIAAIYILVEYPPDDDDDDCISNQSDLNKSDLKRKLLLKHKKR